MISYQLFSDAGGRENNEDCIGMYQKDSSYCFVLADGLGGHGKGEVASSLAVEAAVRTFAEEGAGTGSMAGSFENAQASILKAQREDLRSRDMKTTMVLLQVTNTGVQWGHIGDSRLYYFQEKKLAVHTLDHSVPQMLVASGRMKEKKIRNHPDRNRLLRVLGIEWDSPKFQLEERKERQGKQEFLLCSDGFWELIEEKQMERCLKRADSPTDWLERMKGIVQKAGRGKEMDNYSAIAVWLA